ncbi:hypothetical protein GF342_00090 [Candidatus Woesearchaeota archaeon]|nr:hypothetical protein [Candidatus Woesearchaeota archaeon]
MSGRRLATIVLAGLAGCTAPEHTISLDEIRPRVMQMLEDSQTRSDLLSQTNHELTQGYETGGIVRESNGRYIVVPLRNEFLDLIEYVNELREGSAQHLDNMKSLFARARRVHVRTGNTGVVEAIDKARPLLSKNEWSDDDCKVLEHVARQHILPHTYGRPQTNHEYVLTWHSHPNGSAASAQDLDNSAHGPELVLPYKMPLQVHLLSNGQQYTIVGPTEQELAARLYTHFRATRGAILSRDQSRHDATIENRSTGEPVLPSFVCPLSTRELLTPGVSIERRE